LKNQPPSKSSFILVSTHHGPLLVSRFDYRSVGDSGYGVGYQLLNTGSFDPAEVDLVLQLLKLRRDYFGDGVMAIDCGANIGVHTIEWARLMNGWGSVVAPEKP